MARKNRTRPASAAHSNPQPRQFLLAGIGAVSLGRKRLLQAYANGFVELGAVRDKAQDAVVAAAADMDDAIAGLRRRAERWRKQAQAYRAQVEHRFGPLLQRLGVPVASPRKRRKPAGRAAAQRKRA